MAWNAALRQRKGFCSDGRLRSGWEYPEGERGAGGNKKDAPAGGGGGGGEWGGGGGGGGGGGEGGGGRERGGGGGGGGGGGWCQVELWREGQVLCNGKRW